VVTGACVVGAAVTGGCVTGGCVTGGCVTGGCVTGGCVTAGCTAGGCAAGRCVAGGWLTGGWVAEGCGAGAAIDGDGADCDPAVGCAAADSTGFSGVPFCWSTAPVAKVVSAITVVEGSPNGTVVEPVAGVRSSTSIVVAVTVVCGISPADGEFDAAGSGGTPSSGI